MRDGAPGSGKERERERERGTFVWLVAHVRVVVSRYLVEGVDG